MEKSASDDKILSYNDVVLRRSDLDILNHPCFLNDRIIEFYFSYLSSNYPSEDILLVPPSITFWITNCPDAADLKDFLGPMKLPDKKLVIFPVNNNNDVSWAEGGTHWSLLAFERNANVFVHHDSFGGDNARHARQLFKAVVGFMGVSGSQCEATYQECTDSPQQKNGYDCGLYVTAIARIICSWYEGRESRDGDALWFSAVNEQVSPCAVSAMRNELLVLITSLMASK